MSHLFKKGLILGGLLAAATTIGFAMSKEGQEFSEDVQADLKTLAKQLKKRLHELQDVTEESFDELVKTVVEEFSKEKELAEEVKAELTEALDKMWKEMESEYLAQQEAVSSKK